MKYIIKNCDGNVSVDEICASEDKPCKDIPDCLLKRIVDECKSEINIDIECRGDLAERILSELDIEECE